MATTKKKATTKAGKKTEMELCCGMDLGNGFTKGLITVNGGEKVNIDLPSCIAYVPAGYNWVPAEPTEEYMEDLVNKLDCEIKSPVIPEMDRRRILVGDRAASIFTSLVQFDIQSHTPKSDDPLSIQLLLSSIAATALQAYFEENSKLPESSLQVSVDVGVALPFVDYIKYRQHYIDILEDNKHTVNIYNFDEAGIPVLITFESVSVLAEGEAGQYAITSMGPDFLDAAIAVAKENGLEVDGLRGEDLIDAENVIGVDVGAGTTNYPVFRSDENGGSRIEPGASSSINKGVGTALQRVVDATRSTPYELNSRKELEKLLLKENPTAAQQALIEHLQGLIDEEMDTLARDIITEYTRVISPMKLDVEVIYVFGGGANLVKDALYGRLLKASELAPGVTAPVIILDSTFSRNMNRNGLFMIAEMAREAREA